MFRLSNAAPASKSPRGPVGGPFPRSLGRSRPLRAAFSLVEVTIALGLASFCLLAILGMLQTSLTSEKATVGRTAASGLISSVFADLAATPAGSATSPVYQLSLSNQTFAAPQTIYFSEGGAPTGAVGAVPTADSRYRLSVGIQSPNGSGKSSTPVRILVTWPAAADPNPSQWPAKQPDSFEVVTTLDRN